VKGEVLNNHHMLNKVALSPQRADLKQTDALLKNSVWDALHGK
jgi:hypothetical protein